MKFTSNSIFCALCSLKKGKNEEEKKQTDIQMDKEKKCSV